MRRYTLNRRAAGASGRPATGREAGLGYNLCMPSDLIGLAVALLFCLLPGAGLAIGLGRRLHSSLAKVLPFALAVSAAMAGVLMLFGTGLPLQTATWLYAGMTVAAWVAGYFIGRGRKRLRLGEQGLWVAAAVGVITFIERPWYARSVDTFYHLAAVRSLLATNRAVPTDPIYGVANSGPDPTSGAMHTMVAIWSSVTRVDPEVLWVGLTAVGAALTVLALWALARRVSGKDWAATLAAVGYWMLIQFGDGRAFAYPNRFSYALVFAAMTALVDLAEQGSLPAAALSATALFAAGAVHLGSALLAVVFAVCLVFWKILYALYQRVVHRRFELRPLLWVLGTVAVSLVLMIPLIVLRAAPVAASNLEVSLVYPVRFMSIWGPVGIVGPPPEAGGLLGFLLAACLVVLMGAYALIRHDRVTLAAAAVAGMPLVVTLNPLVASALVAFSPYTVARLNALLGFTLWIAIAWGLSHWRRSVPQVALFTSALILVLAITSIPYLQTVFTPWAGGNRRGEGAWLGASYFNNWRRAAIQDGIDATRKEFGTTYPVVAGEVYTVYDFIGWAPARAAAVPRSHSQFSVEAATGNARRDDMITLLQPDTSEARRREILTRWSIGYVVLDLSRQDQAAALPGIVAQPRLFQPVVSDREYALFKVIPPR